MWTFSVEWRQNAAKCTAWRVCIHQSHWPGHYLCACVTKCPLPRYHLNPLRQFLSYQTVHPCTKATGATLNLNLFILSIDSRCYISWTPGPKQPLQALSPARMVLLLLIPLLLLLDPHQAQHRPVFRVQGDQAVKVLGHTNGWSRWWSWSWRRRGRRRLVQLDRQSEQIKKLMIPYPRIG